MRKWLINKLILSYSLGWGKEITGRPSYLRNVMSEDIAMTDNDTPRCDDGQGKLLDGIDQKGSLTTRSGLPGIH